MKRLAAGCCVMDPDEGEWRVEGTRLFRVPISSGIRAQRIAQIVSRFGPGLSPGWVNPASEEVHYVVTGQAECYIDGFSHPLEPGAAVYVPRGAEFAVENRGKGHLILVSVISPEEKERRVSDPARTVPLTSYESPRRMVLEREREEIESGGRRFRLLVDKDLGCQELTQFIGYVAPGKPSDHAHPSEEAIYILEGEGTLRVGEDQASFRAGTSIYLPPQIFHSLESSSPVGIRLLGVFHPAGSPANRIN